LCGFVQESAEKTLFDPGVLRNKLFLAKRMIANFSIRQLPDFMCETGAVMTVPVFFMSLFYNFNL